MDPSLVLTLPNALPPLSLSSAPTSPIIDTCIQCNKYKQEIKNLQLQLNNVLAQLNVLKNPDPKHNNTILHRHSSR